MWNGTMFVDLDWPLNASSLLSASAELLVWIVVVWNKYIWFWFPHCSYKQYKESFVNRCLFSQLILTCFALWDIDAIWSDLICYTFSPHNWMAFVRLNKRHVILCYVIWLIISLSLNLFNGFWSVRSIRCWAGWGWVRENEPTFMSDVFLLVAAV